MKSVLSFILVLILAAIAAGGTVAEPEVLDRLQANSVTVVAGDGSGSGTLFTRQVGNATITFVWTAAHVVEDETQIAIVKEYTQNGRRVRGEKLDCKVIRVSGDDNGEDLALLEVLERNWRPADGTTVFYGGEIPGVGTEVLHIGSLLGQIGHNSLTTGVVSQVGRLVAIGEGNKASVYDQTDAVIFPGSSGGGLYLDTGEYIGMPAGGIKDAQGFSWYIPIRRIREWAKTAKVEWAMDPNVPVPVKNQEVVIEVKATQ